MTRQSPRRRGPRRQGSSVVEALVGAGLAAVALAGLAAVAGLATQGLRLTRDTSTALAIAGERLEALRAGLRRDGTDVVSGAGGTRFDRAWHVEGGRGLPVRLSVRVTWAAHALALDTEALP